MIEWILNHTFCALYAEMGLGKTIATLTAIIDLLSIGAIGRVLIVAPIRVARYTWPAEIAEWEHTRHLDMTVLAVPLAQRRAAVRDKTTIHVINPENLKWLVEYWGKDWPYDMVVLDEASLFKSHKSQRFKVLRKVRRYIDRMVQLTGTPGGLLDLWSQIFLLDGGERLGKSVTRYRETHFISDYNGYNWTPKRETRAWVEDQIRDICLTLLAKDHLNWEKPVELYNPVYLPDTARSMYRKLEKEFLVEVNTEGDKVVAENAAIKAAKLEQLAQGAVYVENDDLSRSTHTIHDIKLDELEDIVAFRNGQNLLVAYKFQSDLARLKARFPFAKTLDETSPEEWNTGEVPMLLAHPKSAGHGLNLQHGGHVIVWFGLTWSLELYQQFNARLHRSGQTRPVFIHHIVADNTVDNTILARRDINDASQAAILRALRQDIETRLAPCPR